MRGKVHWVVGQSPSVATAATVAVGCWIETAGDRQRAGRSELN